MPAKFINLVGRKFGLLTVTEHIGKNERRQAMYRVICECLEVRIVRGSDLLGGKTQSCGDGCKRRVRWQLKSIFPSASKADPPRVTVSTITGRGESNTRFSGGSKT